MWCVQTNFNNALTRVFQFICTHRRSYIRLHLSKKNNPLLTYLILQVPNYLPSISAAIGGYVPQRNVWRISIALHAFPRFLAALAYFKYHMNFLVEKRRHLYVALAGLCTLLHMVENFALVVLTYISSLDNRGKTCVLFADM